MATRAVGPHQLSHWEWWLLGEPHRGPKQWAIPLRRHSPSAQCVTLKDTFDEGALVDHALFIPGLLTEDVQPGVHVTGKEAGHRQLRHAVGVPEPDGERPPW